MGYLYSGLTKGILATERQRINGGLETTSRCKVVGVVNPSSITINDFPRRAIRNESHRRSSFAVTFVFILLAGHKTCHSTTNLALPFNRTS